MQFQFGIALIILFKRNEKPICTAGIFSSYFRHKFNHV